MCLLASQGSLDMLEVGQRDAQWTEELILQEGDQDLIPGIRGFPEHC